MSKFLSYFNKIYIEKTISNITVTKSQLWLIKLLASGLTLKEIASQNNKTYNNIKKRTQNLYEKFDVSSRYELISILIKNNIINTKDVKPCFRKRFCKISKDQIKFDFSPQLGAREITYLKLVAQGKTQAEIIDIMGLYGLYPVHEIYKIILGQLECKNITRAVYLAKKLEII